MNNHGFNYGRYRDSLLAFRMKESVRKSRNADFILIAVGDTTTL